ncbi:zinc finger, CCHC-type containing protein [Tanacetum coccineum]
MVNSMSYSGPSQGLWGKAMLTACYLLNMVPNKRNMITPYELWTKKKPNLNYLRVWGCRAVVRLPDPKLKTLGERGVECIFVGYAEHFKAFRFSSVPRLSFRIFNETEDIDGSVVPKKVTEEVVQQPEPELKKDDPKTFNEAMKSRDVAFWKEAINDEIDSIICNNTWVLADLPPSCKPLGCKWIFKRKLKVDGTIEKFKARLVIQGFKQKSGIEYFDTYAPVARISTIRLLIAKASIHNQIIHQMDVKIAFLNGDLDEEVYMNQPQGFIMPGNENKVCKLIKSLYGLKQAPKQWHKKFDEVVLSNGYLLNQAEKCVYSKFDKTGKGVIICLYVDNMLIFGTNQVQVDLIKEFLSSRFSMKDIGEADVILGIRIKHESNGIASSHSYYIEKVLKKFNYFNCTPVSTPMDTSEKLMPNNSQVVSQLEYSRVIGYLIYAMTCTRRDIAFAMGKLSRYTSNPGTKHWQAIQRDKSSTSGWVFLLGGGAIFWASKKQTCITGSIMEFEFVALAAAGKEAESKRRRLLQIQTTSHEILTPSPYNTEDKSSTSGWVFLLGGGAIFWASKKQTCITGSIMEFEFVALAAAGKEAECVATLAKAYSQMYNGKSRHLGVRHSMIHELITNGVISIEFVRSQQNLVDHLTKGLAREGIGLKSN